MFPVPSEFAISGVYMPPLLVASALAIIAVWGTAMILSRYRLSRFFSHPPVAFLSIFLIYIVLFGTFVIPS